MTKKNKRRPKHQLIISGAIVIFTAIASYVLLLTNAATPPKQLEAETSDNSGVSRQCEDAAASGGSFMKLNSNVCGTWVREISSFSLGAKELANPTHFDDTYHYWPEIPEGFTQMEYRVKTTGPAATDGYYWSHQHYWTNPDPGPEFDGLYFGVQNFATSHDNVPIAIFSMWNATKAEGPGFVLPFGHEGSGYSVRIPLAWQSGKTYRLWVQKSSDQRGSPADKVWWEAFVQDYPDGEPQFIGAIEAMAAWGNLATTSATFHERYTGPVTPGCPVAQSEGTFTHLMANNGAYWPNRADHGAPEIAACAGLYSVSDIENGYRSVIGGQ